MDTLARVQRRLERERRARREAEAIAERSTRELYDRQQELALLESVAAGANAARTTEQAFSTALEQLCVHLDWPVGQAWVQGADGGTLQVAAGGYCRDRALHGTFLSASTHLRFGPGDGVIGAVLRGAEPAWIRDIVEDPGYRRVSAARAAGLHGAVAFPVVVDDQVAAVLECLSTNVVEPDSQLLRILAQISEHLARVVERVATEQSLRFEANHDTLTGLPNRHRFLQLVGQRLGQESPVPSSTAVAVLGLDRFREVNDTLGHAPGDELLRSVAARLSDALPAGETIARLGGDEFGLVLTGPDRAAVEHAARQARSALAVPFFTAGVQVHVDASIGLAVSPAAGGDADTLMRQAGVALNEAKAGRGGLVVYEPARDQHSSDRLGLAAALRCALDGDQLAVHYQPKIDVAAPSTVLGAEALIRWTHPERGTVSPGEFIPLAESTGLIRPLTTLVLRTVIDQLKAWTEQGLHLPVAVNISASSLRDLDFPQQVITFLDAAGVPARLLELEVTESSMLQDPAVAERSLRSLSDAGITISIDDFGTGYSSMAQLKQLPVNKLKIDRGFVGTMTVDARDGVLVRSTIQLAHNLDLRVVAEGVEDLETLYMLDAMGCDEAQGYLFLPAAPA
ncbi:putative bifunctional diguanylate cyclase/phosphodiesterase, partial [Solicola sp. PLA-1-18]|uniref:putative bifunctional diguanylate cyclase/phosphodiesterase n=1 Tax=Solicola sp. PLA-1-18 TaxID=3380532 RepID=UPI003B783E1A